MLSGAAVEQVLLVGLGELVVAALVAEGAEIHIFGFLRGDGGLDGVQAGLAMGPGGKPV